MPNNGDARAAVVKFVMHSPTTAVVCHVVNDQTVIVGIPVAQPVPVLAARGPLRGESDLHIDHDSPPSLQVAKLVQANSVHRAVHVCRPPKSAVAISGLKDLSPPAALGRPGYRDIC
jgi:hypothetical protein